MSAASQVRTIKEEEQCDSFFNFFDPPEVPEEDDEMDEEEVDQLHETLEADYEVRTPRRQPKRMTKP